MTLERGGRLSAVVWVVAWGIGIAVAAPLAVQLVLTAGAVASFAVMYVGHWRSRLTSPIAALDGKRKRRPPVSGTVNGRTALRKCLPFCRH
jgi:hypothetical protein